MIDDYTKLCRLSWMDSLEFAHTKPDDCDPSHWEPLVDHLTAVAERCRAFASSFGAEELGSLVGALHDVGKSSIPAQNRLLVLGGAKAGIAHSVNHSGAGAKWLWERGRELVSPSADKGILTEFILKSASYLVAGHHAGLADGGVENAPVEGQLAYCIKEQRVPEWNQEKYERFLSPYINRMRQWLDGDDALNLVKMWFLSHGEKGSNAPDSLYWRMLYSCLVDADFLCTEEFMAPERSKARQTSPVLMSELNQRFQEYMDAKTVDMSLPINHIRSEVAQACSRAAAEEQGIFSLTVPTGGGKTLASLRFALEHALKYGLERIIYVIPYTSIIEQTASQLRDIFAACGDHVVLEHHSNYVASKNESQDEQVSWFNLSSENWDAPIIVTTNVQFFESLFSNKSSKCRKIHRIASSVVIFDEVQMIPLNVVTPCLSMMTELVHFRTSLVLCTATQPAFEERDDFKCGLAGVREIIPDYKKLFKTLKRVHASWLNNDPLARYSPETLCEHLKSLESFLCIVDTKKWAADLFELLRQSNPDGKESCFHLSAAMCPVHRTKVLKTVRERLKNGLPCRLVSTQLIEAGVDVDFPHVLRAISGIDSLMQAAGRCNREGKMEEGGTFRLFATEQPCPIPDIRSATDSALEVLHSVPPGEDLLGEAVVRAYFELHFWRKGKELDKAKVMNLHGASLSLDPLEYRFKSVAETFQMINSPGVPVIIPWNAHAEEQLDCLRAAYEPGERRQILRNLQPYCVNVYPQMLEKLSTVLETIHEDYKALPHLGDGYDADKGLMAGLLDMYCV